MSNAETITKALRKSTKGITCQASTPLGFGVDGTIHGSVETAGLYNAAKALMKGVK